MPPNVRALTRAEVSLADWHFFWRHGLFACAVGWMLLSVFALRWAITLTGIPSWAAWAGAAVFEVSMAGTATSATTTRKSDGSSFRSPWLVFSFFMLLAQVCNVGHALVAVSGRLAELPPWMPAKVVYIFAGALAALFPLGGTMLVHMSGFLRAHGADAQWVDTDAQKVLNPTARTDRAPRARTDKGTARTDTAQGDDAQTVPTARTEGIERVPSMTFGLTPEQAALPPRDRARIAYDAMTANGLTPTGPLVSRAARIPTDGDGAVHPATVRRWLTAFATEPATAAANGHGAVTTEELEQMLAEGPA